MKTLTTMIMIAVMTMGIALAGCSNDASIIEEMDGITRAVNALPIQWTLEDVRYALDMARM